jgi:hypothetical protein
MRRVITRGVSALALISIAALGMAQIDVDEAAGKKKKMGKWWGTYVATDSLIERARPGAQWEYTLHVSKGSRTYFLDGGSARLPCFAEDDANPDTEQGITEWYEFQIPDWSGKITVDKKFGEAFVRKPPLDFISLDGQAPSGRSWHVEIGLFKVFYGIVAKRAWYITFPMALSNCEGAIPSALGGSGMPTQTKRVS